jgi:hypothetical protein
MRRPPPSSRINITGSLICVSLGRWNRVLIEWLCSIRVTSNYFEDRQTNALTWLAEILRTIRRAVPIHRAAIDVRIDDKDIDYPL